MAGKPDSIPGNDVGDDTGNDTATGGSDSTIAGVAVVTPGTGATDPTSGIKRGRGRPAGSGGKSSAGKRAETRGEKASSSAVGGIEKILFSLHQMAATFVPEAEIDREESKLLADSLADVSSFYNQVVDPKIIAWVGLLGVCGKLYGPRIVAFRIRRSMTKPATAQQAQRQAAPASAKANAPTLADLISIPPLES